MATKIQWTDDTWNPVTGCTRVSEGCRNCYAEKLTATRLAKQPRYKGLAIYGESGPRWTGEVRLHPDVLDAPLRMRKGRKIFVCDMSDLFHKDVPFEFIDEVFAVMALCPQHVFQVLTKRPERMAEYLSDLMMRADAIGRAADNFADWHKRYEYFSAATGKNLTEVAFEFPLPNAWLGTSVENNDVLWRVGELLRCPARVRFLSVEPLLGRIDLTRIQLGESEFVPHGPALAQVKTMNFLLNALSGAPKTGIPRVDWVIVGGESGHNARPCDIEWIRSIVGQCEEAKVACFVKQLGSRPYEDHSPPQAAKIAKQHGVGPLVAGFLKLQDSKGGDMSEWPEDLRVREFPK